MLLFTQSINTNGSPKLKIESDQEKTTNNSSLGDDHDQPTTLADEVDSDSVYSSWEYEQGLSFPSNH